MENIFDWKTLKENNTLEDFYNILCRNKPNKNNELYDYWIYLVCITSDELLNKDENIQECNKIIDEIIEFLKVQKKEVLKDYGF